MKNWLIGQLTRFLFRWWHMYALRLDLFIFHEDIMRMKLLLVNTLHELFYVLGLLRRLSSQEWIVFWNWGRLSHFVVFFLRFESSCGFVVYSFNKQYAIWSRCKLVNIAMKLALPIHQTNWALMLFMSRWLLILALGAHRYSTTPGDS